MGIIENCPPPPFTSRQEATYRHQIETLTNDGLTHHRIVEVLTQTISAGNDHRAHQVFAWVVRESRAVRSDLIETARADVRRALEADNFKAARAFMKGLKALESGRGKS